MNTTTDLDALRRSAKIVNALAWAVVAGIMIYGIPIVYAYLTTHDIPKQTAWMLSLIADGALAVGMVATPILAQHGVKAWWVGSLRYVAGFATWALNTAGSWFKTDGPDIGGVLSHTWGPLLMFFAVEAAAQFQRKIADVIRKAEADTVAADTARKREAEQRAEEMRRLRAEAEDANRKRAEVEAAFRVEAEARKEAEERAEAEEAGRKSAQAEAEKVRAELDAFRKAQAAERAEEATQFQAEITRLKAEHADAATRFRQQLEEVQASARDARAQAAEASDASSRTAGQLEEARAAADRAIAEKVNAEQKAAALTDSRQAVADELARVRQAHDRLLRKAEDADRNSAAVDRKSNRKGVASSAPADRKSLTVVPALLPVPDPEDVPTVPGVSAEIVARVVAAMEAEPGATQARLAALARTSDRTVRTVRKALPVGTATEDDRAVV